jgi:hypothetical protein
MGTSFSRVVSSFTHPFGIPALILSNKKNRYKHKIVIYWWSYWSTAKDLAEQIYIDYLQIPKGYPIHIGDL